MENFIFRAVKIINYTRNDNLILSKKQKYFDFMLSVDKFDFFFVKIIHDKVKIHKVILKKLPW